MNSNSKLTGFYQRIMCMLQFLGKWRAQKLKTGICSLCYWFVVYDWEADKSISSFRISASNFFDPGMVPETRRYLFSNNKLVQILTFIQNGTNETAAINAHISQTMNPYKIKP